MGFLLNSFARGAVRGANDQFDDGRRLQAKQDLADQTVNARKELKFAEEKAKANKMLNFRKSLVDGMGVDEALAVQISRMPKAMEMDGDKLGEFVKNFAPVQGQMTAPETQTREVLQQPRSRPTGLFSPPVRSREIGYTTGENLPAMQKYQYTAAAGPAKNDTVFDDVMKAVANKTIKPSDAPSMYKSLGGHNANINWSAVSVPVDEGGPKNDNVFDDVMKGVANGTVKAENAPALYKSMGGRNSNINWSAIGQKDDASKKFEYVQGPNGEWWKKDKTDPNPATAITPIDMPNLRQKAELVKSRAFMKDAATSMRQLERVEALLRRSPLAVGTPADIAGEVGGRLTQALNLIYGVEGAKENTPAFMKAFTDFGDKSIDFKNNMHILTLRLAGGLLAEGNDRISNSEREMVRNTVEGLKGRANFDTTMQAFSSIRNVYMDTLAQDIIKNRSDELGLPANVKDDEASFVAYRQKLIQEGFTKESAETLIVKMYRFKNGLL
jgi:hypothetical protein